MLDDAEALRPNGGDDDDEETCKRCRSSLMILLFKRDACLMPNERCLAANFKKKSIFLFCGKKMLRMGDD